MRDALMAVDTGHCAMRPQQRKVGLRVIETRKILPLPRRMTCLATDGFIGCIAHCHPLRELASMYVLMAGSAIEVNEMVGRYFCTRHRLVALIASHCLMAAGQRES